jgi:hypothetical protein
VGTDAIPDLCFAEVLFRSEVDRAGERLA